MSTMHSTSLAMLYACSLEQAKYLAELCGCANNLILAPYGGELSKHARHRPSSAGYYSWEDRQLAGGAIRITWTEVGSIIEGGLMWISCHSGYPGSDMTDDAAEFAAELGYRPIGQEASWSLPENPRIYGYKR